MGCLCGKRPPGLDEEGKGPLIRSTQDLLGNLFELPCWARPRIVMELAWLNAQEGKELSLGLVSGHVVPLALFVTIGRWVFYCTLLVLVWRATPGSNSPRANFEYSWVMWAASAPLQLLITPLELYMFKFVAVPKCQVLGPRKLCGSFYLWLAFTMCLSLLCYFDFTSDTLFFGVQLQAQSCMMGKILSAQWRSVYRGSIWEPYLFDYIKCAALAWSSNFIPCLFALLQSYIPRCSACNDETAYEAPWNVNIPECGVISESGDNIIRETKCWNISKATVFEPKHNHGEALMTLAEVNGLRAVDFDDVEFAYRKAQQMFGKLDAETDAIKKAKQLEGAADHVVSQVRRGVIHCFICGVVVNGQQILLQSATLGMMVSHSDFSTGAKQTAGSLTLSVCSVLVRLYSVCYIGYGGWGYYRRFKESFAEVGNIGDLGTKIHKLGRWMRLLVMSTCICVCALIMMVAKLYKMHSCSHSVWTVRGCWTPDDVFKRECITIAKEFLVVNSAEYLAYIKKVCQ